VFINHMYTCMHMHIYTSNKNGLERDKFYSGCG
jgi:hypothetical protein